MKPFALRELTAERPDHQRITVEGGAEHLELRQGGRTILLQAPDVQVLDVLIRNWLGSRSDVEPREAPRAPLETPRLASTFSPAPGLAQRPAEQRQSAPPVLQRDEERLAASRGCLLGLALSPFVWLGWWLGCAAVVGLVELVTR